MSRAASSSPSLCFLLGLPRSGTTLLAHLLGQHPDLLAPPEPWLMLALESFGQVDRDHPAEAKFIRVAVDEFLGRIDRAAAYRAMADSAYGQYLAAAGKCCFIDKTPRYWMAIETIDTLYPDAAKIVLLRNPFAIAASLKSTWGIPLLPDNCLPGYTAYLADLVLGLPALAARRDHPNTQLVHYEALVRQPREEVRRIVAALGYDPAGIASTAIENTDYLKSGSLGDRKILEKKSVDDRSIEAWRGELSLAEMQAVADIVGADLFAALGYEEDLQYAYEVGVADRGSAVAQRHRAVFATWRALIRDEDKEAFTACDPSIAEDARRLTRTEVAEIAQLRHTLAVSEADRAARLDVIHRQDAALRDYRELKQSLWWRIGRRLHLTPNENAG